MKKGNQENSFVAEENLNRILAWWNKSGEENVYKSWETAKYAFDRVILFFNSCHKTLK